MVGAFIMPRLARSHSARPYARAMRPFSVEPDLVHVASDRPQTTQPRLIAVASGKGGVGKTWFSITLAHALTRGPRPSRVLIVDGDFGLANVDIQLGLGQGRDIVDVLKGQASIEEVIRKYEFPLAKSRDPRCHVDILPGRSGPAGNAALETGKLAEIIEQLRNLHQYDLILFDLCAGIDWSSRMVAASADTLVVVTTEEPTALTDAYAVLKLSMRDRDRDGLEPGQPQIVINQASSYRSGRSSYATITTACERFLGCTPSLAGIIRRDTRIPEAIRWQTPLLSRHPSSPAGQDVEKIARLLSRQGRDEM